MIVNSLAAAAPWLNPKGARALALHMYQKENADVVFGIAASSNMGKD
jgi:hypothetical protein